MTEWDKTEKSVNREEREEMIKDMKEGSQQAKKERDIKSGNQEIKENKKRARKRK